MKVKQAIIIDDLVLTNNILVEITYYAAETQKTTKGRIINFDEYSILIDASEKYRAKQERVAFQTIISIYNLEEFTESEDVSNDNI